MTLPPPQKKQKNNGKCSFWLGSIPEKTKGIGIWKKKKMELTDFLIGILPNFMFRGVNGFRFSLTSGEGFFRSVPSLSLTFRPPKLTVMKKSLLVLSRSGLKTQGPYSWQVSGRDWYQLTCKKWDPLKWPQQVSLRPEDLGFMTTRGALTPHVLSLGHLQPSWKFKGAFLPGPEGHDVCTPKKNMALLRGKKSPSLSLHNPIIRPHFPGGVVSNITE